MWTVGEQPSYSIDSIEYLVIGCIATRPRPRILLVTRLYLGPLYDQYFMINDLLPARRRTLKVNIVLHFGGDE